MPPSTLSRLIAAVFLVAQPALAQPDDSVQESLDSTNVEYVLSVDPIVQDDVRELLKDRGYRFCQDPDYRLFSSEKKALCGSLPSLKATCPQLAQACARPAWEDAIESDDESWFDWDSLDIDGSFLAILLKGLFWGGVAFGVIVLLRALLKQARMWRDEKKLEELATPSLLVESDAHEVEELRAPVLFDMAQAELRENRITEALHLTYRGTVRTLCDAEWVKPHRSKTSGDYQRTLRKLERRNQPQEPDPEQPPARDHGIALPVNEVRVHLRDLDRERFCQVPSANQADVLLQRALEIASRLTHLSAILFAFSLIGCSELGSSAPEDPSQPQAPRGSQLFHDLLLDRAPSLHRRLHRVTDLPEQTASVISIGAHLKEVEWEVLRRHVDDGGHLVVAAPTETFFEVFGLDGATAECDGALIAPDLSVVGFYEGRQLLDIENGYVEALCGSSPYASTFDYNAGSITLIADELLFENVSLAAAENASLALELVGGLYGHVEYLGPWTGRGSHHPLQSINRAGFGWWVIHILLLAMIYAWSRGKRFGTPQDPPEGKRRAFTEHARALSLKYEKAGASGWALRSYAEWVYDHLRKRAPSTKSDLKSLTRAVSSSDREAMKLRDALTTARRADELGEMPSAHHATFRKLKSAILGISDVSRNQTQNKD